MRERLEGVAATAQGDFRRWAAKLVPEAEHMNTRSDPQLRHLLFAGAVLLDVPGHDEPQPAPYVSSFRVSCCPLKRLMRFCMSQAGGISARAGDRCAEGSLSDPAGNPRRPSVQASAVGGMKRLGVHRSMHC